MSIRRDPRVAAAVLLMAMSSTREVAAAIVSTTSTRASSAFVQVPVRAMPQARQARSMAPAAAGLPIAGRGGFSPLLSKAPLSQAPAAAGFTALPLASRAAAGSSSSGWLWRNSATSAAGSSVRMCANAAAAGGEVECETVQGKVIGIEGNLATVKVNEDGQGTSLQGVTAEFDCGAVGTVMWQRTPLLWVLLDKSPDGELGKVASITSQKKKTVPVGADLVGRAVDHLLRPTDGGSALSQATMLPMFGLPTSQPSMATISKPLHTGITAIDSLTPIGRGQNMLLVGPLSCGRRDLAVDAVCNQKQEGVTCVYVCTKDNPDEILSELKRRGAMEHTVFVSAGGGGGKGTVGAAECVAAAASGCSIAENLMRKGEDTLVVIDDLERHRDFWDRTEKTLIEEFGVGAVASDASALNAASSEMRIFYSSLFQRVGYLNKKSGGGSLSMLVLVEKDAPGGAKESYSMDDFDPTLYGSKIRARLQLLVDRKMALTPEVLKKLDIALPEVQCGDGRFQIMRIEDLMSLSDGQVMLDNDLFDKGRRPPIEPRTSLTRVGIGHDALAVSSSSAMRAVGSSLRFELAQTLDIPNGDTSADSQRLRNLATGYQVAMHQEKGRTRSLGESVVAIYAAQKGLLHKFAPRGDVAKGAAVLDQALEHLKGVCGKHMDNINTSLEWSFETRTAIDKELRSFLDSQSA